MEAWWHVTHVEPQVVSALRYAIVIQIICGKVFRQLLVLLCSQT